MKQRLLCLVLCILFAAGLFPSSALAATDWPGDVSIESDAGIVMDAKSGAVLYGKNIHSTYSPASITKVLTALVVLENCQMDEMVTFSKNAVYNVEANSTSAGYDTGDQATVKDCLYAVVLKSANEAANALAEHIAGTTENFAEMMNAKAAELGCQDSHFTNPSGLNDENHYVSAYDMALITRAAFENEMFSKIASTTYYNLPPNKLNPEGQGISPGNKMVKPNWPDQYRPEVIGGKTGYTSIALNTLVTCAEKNDTRLVTVILFSKATQYNDTKKLLDFGFGNFQSIKISDYDKTYSSIGDNLKISGLPTSEKPILTVDPDSRITLPKAADFSEATAVLDYALPAGAPDGAIACVNYTLDDRFIGYAFLTLTDAPVSGDTAVPMALLEVTPTAIESAEMTTDEDAGSLTEGVTGAVPESKETAAPKEQADKKPAISLKIPAMFWKILAAIVIVGGLSAGLIFFFSIRRRKELEDQQMRRMRRAERLRESGISESEFNLMMQERYSNPASSRNRNRRRSSSKSFRK